MKATGKNFISSCMLDQFSSRYFFRLADPNRISFLQRTEILLLGRQNQWLLKMHKQKRFFKLHLAKSRSGTAIHATLQLKVKETRFSTSKGKKHKAAYEALNVNNMTLLLNIVPTPILKKSSQPDNDSGKSDALK